MINNAAIELDWYFDFISPFAYLQLEQFERLPAHVKVTFKPLVLGALLSHWETKGPAGIPEKRRHLSIRAFSRGSIGCSVSHAARPSI